MKFVYDFFMIEFSSSLTKCSYKCKNMNMKYTYIQMHRVILVCKIFKTLQIFDALYCPYNNRVLTIYGLITQYTRNLFVMDASI